MDTTKCPKIANITWAKTRLSLIAVHHYYFFFALQFVHLKLGSRARGTFFCSVQHINIVRRLLFLSPRTLYFLVVIASLSLSHSLIRLQFTSFGWPRVACIICIIFGQWHRFTYFTFPSQARIYYHQRCHQRAAAAAINLTNSIQQATVAKQWASSPPITSTSPTNTDILRQCARPYLCVCSVYIVYPVHSCMFSGFERN